MQTSSGHLFHLSRQLLACRSEEDYSAAVDTMAEWLKSCGVDARELDQQTLEKRHTPVTDLLSYYLLYRFVRSNEIKFLGVNTYRQTQPIATPALEVVPIFHDFLFPLLGCFRIQAAVDQFRTGLGSFQDLIETVGTPLIRIGYIFRGTRLLRFTCMDYNVACL